MHECPFTLITCMDYRLREALPVFMARRYDNPDYDLISVAGSGKEIADNNPEISKFLLKQIEISRNLHHSNVIVLVHHSDCETYKNAYSFKNDDDEFKKQLEDIHKTEKIIKKNFPEMHIERIWAKIMPDTEDIVFFHLI